MSGVHRGVTLSWPEITQRNRDEIEAGNYDLYIPNRTLMALIEAEYPDLVADGVMYENGAGNVYLDPRTQQRRSPRWSSSSRDSGCSESSKNALSADGLRGRKPRGSGGRDEQPENDRSVAAGNPSHQRHQSSRLIAA